MDSVHATEWTPRICRHVSAAGIFIGFQVRSMKSQVSDWQAAKVQVPGWQVAKVQVPGWQEVMVQVSTDILVFCPMCDIED